MRKKREKKEGRKRQKTASLEGQQTQREKVALGSLPQWTAKLGVDGACLLKL